MVNFISEEEYRKFQTEWALVNLVKELRGISNRGAMPTYYNAIKLAMQILPDIFNEKSYMVQRHHEPEIIRLYRQQAEAQSQIDGKRIEPIDLLDTRIATLTKLIGANKDNADLLEKELDKLHKSRTLLVPKNIQEDYILHHDVKSLKFGVEPIDIRAKHADYSVGENRIIRVRMIHPNNGEQSMGADLIYEQYNTENKFVRFLMVQYKIWEAEIIYWSRSENLSKQLQKMTDNLCSKGYCNCDDGNNVSGEFRYPFCTGFLRPTDKLQFKDSRFTSSGMHVPICKLKDLTEETTDGNKVLRKNKMRHASLSQNLFEECFNYNQIGSRWLNYTELEKLYKEHKILESDEHIIVHVQELEL
jgi:hypothetical protein